MGTNDDDEVRTRPDVVRAAGDTVLHSFHALSSMATSAGDSVLGALPEPVGVLVARSRTALQELLDLVPPVVDEIDVLADELAAKRVSIRALQAELGALDLQLAVVERSLAPLQVWSHRWQRLQASLIGGAPGDD